MSFAASGALDPRGPAARAIADLWWLMVVLGAATFVVFAVVLIGGLVRGSASAEDPGDERPSRLILLGGVALPSVVLIIVLGFTVRTMHTIPNAAPEGALQIEVVGHQWWWEIRYPNGVISANEVHIPAGRPVRLELTTADVIHSFWVPALAGKMDLVPGRSNTLWIDTDRPGVYEGQCAEFCGLQHAKMRLLAVAEPEGRFSEWLARQRAPAATPGSPSADEGQQVFAGVGCASCHTVRGTAADGTGGPDLTHLASRRTLAAATVPNTPEHLEVWVTDPHAIKEGVEMPATELDERQRRELIEYLEGLR
ncbi:MAG: cytochrome c oxidase subunit II [Actinobacteria bacterium]|nr:cytochrome c oxidase subunit II [Actinomycetota bacterium]